MSVMLPYLATRSRFLQYGLINLRQIDAIGATRLPTFNAEFLTKVHSWVFGVWYLQPLVSDMTAFFACYGIHLTDYTGHVKAAKASGPLSIGDRANHWVAANALFPGRTDALAYWSTVMDVLCYRGLQDNIVCP